MKRLLTFLCALWVSMSLSQTLAVTIGEVNNRGSSPYYLYHDYSSNQAIYTASEIGGSMQIGVIAYHVAQRGSTAVSSLEIYMGHRTSDSFSGNNDCEPLDNLTLVYSGTPTLAATYGWEPIFLDTPFNYNGLDHLVVVVCKKSTNSNYADYFLTSSAKTQCLYRFSDNESTYSDPSNTSYYKSVSYRPYITLLSSTYAKDGILYEIDSEEAIVKFARTVSGDVSIPSSVEFDGKSYNVTSIASFAFSGNTNVKSLVIPNSVRSIGDYSFYMCTGLTSIDIPGTVSTIGESSFMYCNFSSVVIPDGVTTIGANAFYGCSSLTSVEIPQSVTSIGEGAFRDCSSLIVIDLPEGLCRIEDGTFSGCSELSSVEIPSSVTSIGASAFSGCHELQSICIPYGVCTIGRYAFYYCTAIKSVTIPENVTTIEASVFEKCTKLEEVILPENLTSIGYRAFYDTNLKSIDIPDSVTSIGESAFDGCYHLKEVYIGKNVANIGNSAFYCCYDLRELHIKAMTPPTAESLTFYRVGAGCILYVPEGTKDVYASTRYWCDFTNIIEEASDNGDERCEKPVISYHDGMLMFESATPGATYQYTLTDSDIRNQLTDCLDGQVKLKAAYQIKAYAKADGKKISEPAYARIYWVDAEYEPESLTLTPARPIVVQIENGVLRLSGLEDGELVEVYRPDGSLIGVERALDGAVLLSLPKSGDNVIVKLLNQSIKLTY